MTIRSVFNRQSAIGTRQLEIGNSYYVPSVIFNFLDFSSTLFASFSL